MQTLLRYLLIATATTGIVALQGALSEFTGTVFVGLIYPMTFFIAWKWGVRAGLFNILISIVTASYFIIPPVGSFSVGSFYQYMPFLVYGVTTFIVSVIINRSTQTSKNLRNRFRRSQEAINLGVWYCDLPFSELRWDKTVKEHFWLPEDARVTIETFYERLHPDDREKTRIAIETSIAERGPYDIVYRTTNPADPRQVKHIRAIGWTDYDAHGKPIRFDGITLDNTQLRKVSDDLNETIEVVETINKVGRSLSAELDQKKLVQLVTDAATQLARAEFGAFFYNVLNEKGESYTLYTVSGAPMEAFSKFPMPRNTEVFAPTFAGEGIIRVDDITKDPRYGKNAPYHGMPEGHLPVVSYLAVPVISRTGEVIGGLFLGHKEKGMFSEREEKLVAGLAGQIAIAMDNARLFQKLNESVRLRDEFLSISSHELKTPLTSLKMQLQLFSHIIKKEQGPVPEERVKKIVEVSERQVNRLNSLVEDLLDVTRIQSGKLSLNFEDVDLAELAREVVDRYSPLVRQTGCTIECHIPAALVSSVDRIRFEQILINLISNSMKYAPGSQISISLFEKAGIICFSVKDNGPGIRKEDQARIFDRFERVSAREGKGLGLGLYIVRQIVEAHAGSIDLRSVPGQGAEFMICFPRK